MEKAEGRYTMLLPPSAWDTGFRGIDEFYREWRIGRLRFLLIHEPMGILSYSKREQEFGKGFRESIAGVNLDGLMTVLVAPSPAGARPPDFWSLRMPALCLWCPS